MINALMAPIRFAWGIFERSLVVRYVFSGGTSAAIDVGLLFVLTHYLGIYYLAATALAMTASFIARFLLQKYVTFKNKDEAGAQKQLVLYTILYVFSLFATTAFMYLFVDLFALPYLPAQIYTIAIIAVISFFVYRLLIFKK